MTAPCNGRPGSGCDGRTCGGKPASDGSWLGFSGSCGAAQRHQRSPRHRASSHCRSGLPHCEGDIHSSIGPYFQPMLRFLRRPRFAYTSMGFEPFRRRLPGSGTACMQDLAAYIAERLPAQAKNSPSSSISVPQEQPREARQGRAEILDTLAGLLSNVLGVDISAHKPFLEASAPRCHVSTQ